MLSFIQARFGISSEPGLEFFVKNKTITICFLLASAASLLTLAGCGRVQAQADADAKTVGLPPDAKVVPFPDASLFSVDHPEQFPLAMATERAASPELNVTGVVNPDASRQVPVPSLATGRVVEIDARLGDEVKKGQLLFKVRSADIAGAYSDYRKAIKNEQLAVKNEELAKIQLDRAR